MIIIMIIMVIMVMITRWLHACGAFKVEKATLLLVAGGLTRYTTTFTINIITITITTTFTIIINIIISTIIIIGTYINCILQHD